MTEKKPSFLGVNDKSKVTRNIVNQSFVPRKVNAIIHVISCSFHFKPESLKEFLVAWQFISLTTHISACSDRLVVVYNSMGDFHNSVNTHEQKQVVVTINSKGFYFSCSYTHRYIQLLEVDGRVDALEVVNERIRKRFKNPKLVGAQSSQVCKHASFAWCRALCTALCSITTISQEALPTTSWDQEAHLVVDLQVCLSFCSLQAFSFPHQVFSVAMVFIEMWIYCCTFYAQTTYLYQCVHFISP